MTTEKPSALLTAEQRHEINLLDNIAGDLYNEYCAAVGGFAFNGDVLPSWDKFRADPSKLKQSDAWIRVAQKALKAVP